MATSGNYTWTPSTYGPGVGYPNRAKITWNATWNQSAMLWTVNWNATAQGASTAGRWTTVYGSNNGCNSYVTVTDAYGNVLQTKNIVAKMETVKNDTVLLEGSFNVGVDVYGNQSLTFAGQINFETTGSAGISSGSQAFALDNIPLASTISSISPGSVAVTSSGGTVTVNIARNNPAYTHTVVWAFGGYSATQTGQGTSASYTIPATWLAAIPSSPSGVASVTVTTFNGATQIGTAASATFTVVADVYPSIGSFVAYATGAAATAGISGYVAGYSNAYLEASSVAGAYGSGVAKYEFISGNSVIATYNSSAGAYAHTTGVLNSSATFYVRVTDTRGRQVTSSPYGVTVDAYATPAFTSFSVYRSNSSGTAAEDGTYVTFSVSAAATPSGAGRNAITSITYRDRNGNEQALSNGSTSIVSGYSNTSSYDIRVTATDKLGNSSYRYVTIPTQAFTMDFKVGGKGVAFGKVAETDNLVDSAWDIRSRGAITAENKLWVAAQDNYPEVNLQRNTDASRGASLTNLVGTNSNRLYLNAFHRSNDTNSTTYVDQYWLPASETDNASHVYDIVTTKNTDISANVVAGSNVTLGNMVRVVRNGNFISGYVRFTVTAPISPYAYIFTGIPAAQHQMVFQVLDSFASPANVPNVYADSGNAGLRATNTIPAGSYSVYFTYMTYI